MVYEVLSVNFDSSVGLSLVEPRLLAEPRLMQFSSESFTTLYCSGSRYCDPFDIPPRKDLSVTLSSTVNEEWKFSEYKLT